MNWQNRIYESITEIRIGTAVRAIRHATERGSDAVTKTNVKAAYHRNVTGELGDDATPLQKDRSKEAETNATAAADHANKKHVQGKRIEARLAARVKTGHLLDPKDKDKYKQIDGDDEELQKTPRSKRPGVERQALAAKKATAAGETPKPIGGRIRGLTATGATTGGNPARLRKDIDKARAYGREAARKKNTARDYYQN